MKPVESCLRLIVIVLVLLSKPAVVFTQSPPPPDYTFTSPALISGVDRAVGAVYRFSNVKTGVDVLVTITDIVNATLTTLDQTGGGYNAAFQPFVTVNSMTTGYVEFQIDFVVAGTSTPMTQNEVNVTALDIDGYNQNANQILHEFDEFDLGPAPYVDYELTGSDIDVTYGGSAIRATNIGGVEYGGINTSPNVRFTVFNSLVSSMVVRSGAINNDVFNNVSRQRSLYFARFSYPNSALLPAAALKNFSGKRTKDNRVDLSWQLQEYSNLLKIDIERKTGDGAFEVISTLNKLQGNQYHFIDNNPSGDNSYYRLKLYETDGKTSYSQLLKVAVQNTGNTSFAVNPSVITGQAALTITAGKDMKGTFRVTDMHGREVIQKPLSIPEGVTLLDMADLASLKPGNYIAVLYADGQRLVQRLVVAGH